MSATPLLKKLRQAGLSVSREGDQLIVTPRDRLTDEFRAEIRGSKRELLDELERIQIATTLEPRIRAMAERWGFSANELAEELSRAAADPMRGLIWVERDEYLYGDCKTSADFATAYSHMRRKVL